MKVGSACAFVIIGFVALGTGRALAQADQDQSKCYLSFNVTERFSGGRSAGRDELLGSSISGMSTDDGIDLGASIGRQFTFSQRLFRAEIEATSRSDYDFLTRDFRGDPFSEESTFGGVLDDHWSIFANLWHDITVGPRTSFYLGGGIGISGGRLTVEELIFGDPSGSKWQSEDAWQFGAGVVYQSRSGAQIDFGYRYLDFGVFRTKLKGPDGPFFGPPGPMTLGPLPNPFNTPDGGELEHEMTGHAIQVSIRYAALSQLIGLRR
ncbi:outer membrane protein [Roseiconus lacunae]|uniref:outer membrane protein n=1 Tax=Roseiconus lacunae TaxID=2605694 RepID=UPI001E287A34|nr:outer membrane beta-barrel protein [Roseiconus lacunae]MCD0457849.1 outer membrane beta-barrel protein [Roseiconus lacunae]